MAKVSPSRLPARFAPHLKTLLLCLALALPGFFAARHVVKWPTRLSYPGELDSVEGRELAEMTLLRRGEPVYAPPSPGSFHAMNYGPLFYLLGSRLVDPHQPAYLALRIVATLGTLGLAAACGLLAWWISRSRVAAALAVLMFLAYAFVSLTGVCARSDSVALLLGFGGFLVAYKFQRSSKLLWSIPLLALGIYYKQQYIAAPLAILLFLVLEKRYRLALQFAGILGAAGLGLLGAFEFLIFPRQAFLLHFLTYNMIPFSWREELGWLPILAVVFAAPCLMALRALYLRPRKLLACYLGCAACLLPIMISKQGTQMNYGFELLLMVCPLAASLVEMRLDSPRQAAPLVYLLGVAMVLGQLTRRGSGDPAPEDFVRDSELQVFLRASFPPQTPAYGDFTGDLVQAGLATPITDLFQYTWLACAGKVPRDWLAGQLSQRQFGVILMSRDLTSEAEANEGNEPHCLEPARQAILQNYRLARTFENLPLGQNDYYVWVPR